MNTTHVLRATVGLMVAVVALAALLAATRHEGWSRDEKAVLASLSLNSLPPLPSDPSNAVADDPRAVTLGHRLFFDTRLSGDGRVSCATCHQPGLAFTDGLPLAEGAGKGTRKTMTITGTAYGPWLFWDGRKDSQWSQALAPLENPVEHATDRTSVAHVIARHHAAAYEAIFGPLPDLEHLPPSAGPVEDPGAAAAWDAMTPADREDVTRVFANAGKAIAAYERRLVPGPSRFDRYVESVLTGDRNGAAVHLSEDEIGGLRLFIGEAGCTNCHNGPLFTNHEFHNTGVPARAGLPEDTGRALGARQVLADEFNCLGPYSDAEPGECADLRFLKAEGHELERAFKPPTLRNVAEAAPYMHAGQFTTLRDVLEHYDAAPAAPAGHSELEPLDLNEKQLQQLEAFLRSLGAPLATPRELLRPPRERAFRPIRERSSSARSRSYDHPTTLAEEDFRDAPRVVRSPRAARE